MQKLNPWPSRYWIEHAFARPVGGWEVQLSDEWEFVSADPTLSRAKYAVFKSRAALYIATHRAAVRRSQPYVEKIV